MNAVSSPPTARRTGWWSTPRQAEERGLQIIIAGAGGAAHLPGMVAGHTLLPVIGVPIQSRALNGLDSLLSIVQMPAGVPVATMAIGQAGATNAALLAVSILGAAQPHLRVGSGSASGSSAPPRYCRKCLKITPGCRKRNRANPFSPVLPSASLAAASLGRMLALAARAMGYRIHTFSPDRDSPTGQVADREVCAPYADLDAVRDFVRQVAVVTFEFENVAAAVAQVAEEEGVPVRPGGWVLHTTQQRLREKQFLARRRPAGHPVCRRAQPGRTGSRCLPAVGTPAILKTAAFGYDGKGQVRIDAPSAAQSAWEAIGKQEAMLEAVVDFACELSVVAARGLDGSFAHWGVIENIHRNHILDLSLAPAPLDPRVAEEAVDLAHAVLEQLDVVGVLCVEMFLDRRGRLLGQRAGAAPAQLGSPDRLMPL